MLAELVEKVEELMNGQVEPEIVEHLSLIHI